MKNETLSQEPFTLQAEGPEQTPENNIKDAIRERKRKAKEIEQAYADEILKKRDEIALKLSKGMNLHPIPSEDDNNQTLWLGGRGNKGLVRADGSVARIALVGLFPSHAEIRNKPNPSVMVGASGKALTGWLEALKINPSSLYFTNLVKYFKAPKSKLTGAEINLGRDILIEELKFAGIEYVICLGSKVYEALNKDKRFKASDFAGVYLPGSKCRGGFRLAGLHNPAYLISSAGESEIQPFVKALDHLIKQAIKGDSAMDEMPYGEIEDEMDALDWLDELLNESRRLKAQGRELVLSIDTECEVVKEGALLRPTNVFTVSTSFGPLDVLCGSEGEIPAEVRTHVWSLEKCPDYKEWKPASQNELSLFASSDASTDEVKKTIVVIEKDDPLKVTKLTEIQKSLSKGVTALSLDCKDIVETDLASDIGKRAVRTVLTRAIKEADYTVMNNGFFDKGALEMMFSLDFVEELSECEICELMLESHLTNENDSRSLKDLAAEELGWIAYAAPLEAAKAEYQTQNYLHIPHRIQANYAARDAVATLLCFNAKRAVRTRKARDRAPLIKHYFDGAKPIVGKSLSDPEIHNPNVLIKDVNRLSKQLYAIKRTGMPVGEAGQKKAAELIDFYETHYRSLEGEMQDKAKGLLGINSFNPSSAEEVSHVLYAPRSKGGMGFEPLKESGSKGRLWNKIPSNERPLLAGGIDQESFSFILRQASSQAEEAFVKRLGETRKIKSLKDSFFADPESGSGFFSRIGDDGRLHTEYSPTTDTMRFKSKPNLANPPKKEGKGVEKIVGERPPWELRNIVTADPDHVLLFRDWTSAEVYLLMFLSNDTEGLRVIEKGFDFHLHIGRASNKGIQKAFDQWKLKDRALMEKAREEIFRGADSAEEKAEAQKLFDYCTTLFESDVEKNAYKLFKITHSTERGDLKPVTFGVPYGESAEGMARQQGKPVEECQRNIDGYKSTYQQATAFLDHNGNFSMNYRMIPSPWGYVRNFGHYQRDDEVYRQGLNFQLQHGVAVMMLQTINDWGRIKAKYNLKTEMFLSLYDACGWHIPVAEAETMIQLSHELMTVNRPVGPLDPRTIPTEGEIQEYWEGPNLPGYEGYGATGLQN